MPARAWQNGIYSFLELLRLRQPTSTEAMLTFFNFAYGLMALLYETVPAFEDSWIECMGDLGRYRLTIKDEDVREREVMTAVSRSWYSKASDKAPTTGRLYHHLAILAHPIERLYFYAKSLCVPIPFSNTRESIMTWLDPLLAVDGFQHPRLAPMDVAFVKAHGYLFSQKSPDKFQVAADKFIELLDDHISRTTHHWTKMGYFIAVSNACSLLSYGKDDSVITKAIQSEADGKASEGASTLLPASFTNTLHLVMGTHQVVLHRLISSFRNVGPSVWQIMS
ncbi:hypothetical protein F5Y17DRAFT_452466 [Xylariaceae sp. FL0594]|nr:hypothetical protein F5Y17DRAFT_452466 [Xylariaceae sp. FL0594]